MPEEHNGSSELGVGQPMATRGKLLLPAVPGSPQVYVNKKQYNAILRMRKRRGRIAARMANAKKTRLRGPKGRFCRTEDKKEAPVGDLECGLAATNDEEIGDVAYNSILNLEAPDCTSLLKIMLGERYNNEVSEQFNAVMRLPDPSFALYLTVMNNVSYDPALDDGYYDVEKVLQRLEGW